jgi:hypothetical protein
MTTLIQEVEKGLGREPPMPRSDQLAEERYQAAAEEARARIKARDENTLEESNSGTITEDDSFLGSILHSDGVGSIDDTLMGQENNILIGFSVILAILVVALSVAVIRLAKQNKRMRESSFFSDNLISGIGRQSETFMWFRRNSPKNKEYRKFLVELKKLVKQHHEENGIHITMNEGWRDK